MLNLYRRLCLGLSSALLVWGGASLLPAPGQAAQQIKVKYGPFYRTVPVSALEEYAETGEAPRELAGLLRFVGREERESLLQGLKFGLPLDVVTVDQLLRSEAGDRLLEAVAPATDRPDQAGKLAIRGGLILAAASDDGLSVLNFIKKYPGVTMTLDVAKAQDLLSGDGLQGLLGSFFQGQPQTPAPSNQ